MAFERTTQVGIRMTPAERARLEELARACGQDKSKVVRELIRKARVEPRIAYTVEIEANEKATLAGG